DRDGGSSSGIEKVAADDIGFPRRGQHRRHAGDESQGLRGTASRQQQTQHSEKDREPAPGAAPRQWPPLTPPRSAARRGGHSLLHPFHRTPPLRSGTARRMQFGGGMHKR